MARTQTRAPSSSTAPSAASVLGRVTLVTGKEEFLSERTMRQVKAAVLAHDPEAEFTEAEASSLTAASLGELSAPSLFSSVRCVAVRSLENLPDESADGILAYAAAPVDDVALVLMHSGGAKGSGLLAKLRKLPGVVEVKSEEPKPSDFPRFVEAEVRSHGGQIAGDAAVFLVQAVGQDLRGLAAAADQLCSDFAGRRIDEAMVQQYYGGRAEVKNYAIADAMIAGDRGRAFEELRWALETGSAPVYILSAVTAQVRTLANHVAGNRDSRVPDWRLRTLSQQARGWSAEGLASALQAVAKADADLKGQASDPAYTMERLILTIAALRGGR